MKSNRILHHVHLLDDHYTLHSTIATSQYPIDKWHETMEPPTLADAILDRLVNNAHRIQLTGGSMRKKNGEQELHAQNRCPIFGRITGRFDRNTQTFG